MNKRHHLRLKRIGIDTYRENVVYMHRECRSYRTEGFQALSKIEVRRDGSSVQGVLNVVDDSSILEPGDLGLSEQAFQRLGAEAGSEVVVAQAEPPQSMDSVRSKILGERLDLSAYRAITADIAAGHYSKMEIAAFLVAAGQGGLDRDEVLFLTRAMLETGDRLHWDETLLADKHCIGGIPGNRTSMLVVPIVAAHGISIPKTSSRAITSPAGTADTMEVLAEVELPPERLRELVHSEHGCLAWGGTARLAPVDDILISVERPLAMDSAGQMVASILSKKLAAGSTHLLLDIPVGPSAKVRNMREAMYLRRLFEYVGTHMNLHLEVVITDGRQPIGRGIGPVLEARDVMQILDVSPRAANDLREKSLRLAGRIIEFDPDVRGGSGYTIARDILESGRAMARMQRIIERQGRRRKALAPGSLTHVLKARESGTVTAIDNRVMARIARQAGAPMDKGAGVDLLCKLGDVVTRGQPLYRIHSDFHASFDFAKASAERDIGYIIGAPEQMATVFAEF